MNLVDFMGLFTVWAGFSIAMVLYASLPRGRLTQRCRKAGCKVGGPQRAAGADEAEGKQEHKGEEAAPSPDDEAEMLREVLRQLADMRTAMDAQQQAATTEVVSFQAE